MTPFVANDFPWVSDEFLKLSFSIPQAWSFRGVGFGMYSVSTLWAWPVDLLYGIGGRVGFSFAVLEWMLGIAPIFIIGFFAITKLMGHYKIGFPGKWIGALFFLVNTYILLLIDGGQFSIGLAYAFLPLAFLSSIRAFGPGYFRKMLYGLAVVILGALDIRFLALLGVLLVYYLVFERPRIGEVLKAGTIAAAIFVGLNAYWILPLLFSQAATLPVNYTRVSQATFLGFTEFKHAVFLSQPNWYKNIFGVVQPVSKEFVLIPILAFLPVVVARNKRVYFWIAVGLTAIFLTKGANPPLPQVYQWLYAHIPGFFVFRDSTKFFSLIALSYSLLLAISTNMIIKAMPKLRAFVLLGLAVYLIFLIRPVYLGKMTGVLARPVNFEEYSALAQIFKNDEDFGRVVWLPRRPPLGYASELHSQLDGLTLTEKRPFAAGTVGKYETLNFLRESPIVGELMKISGIKYISYPFFDERREGLEPEDISYYHAFSEQLEALPWIEEKIYGFPVNTFVTKENEDRFFVAENTFCIVGSDRIYWELSQIPGFSLTDNAVLFLEERPNILATLPEKACSVVIYEKEKIDFAASLIDETKHISLAVKLPFSPEGTKDGWWKREATDFIWWRDFLQQKYGIDSLDFDYGQGWAVAEGEKQLTISSQLFESEKVLLARVMRSSKGGEVVFLQNGREVGRVNTFDEDPQTVTQALAGHDEIPSQLFEYDKADFLWYEVGELSGNGEIVVSTKGEINVVNSLVVLGKREWNSAKEVASGVETAALGQIVSGREGARADYTRLSPTHYKVVISGLNSPSTLVFSETYNPLWKLEGQNSFQVYSLFNGFRIDRDGVYELTFEPQRRVNQGFVVFIATLFSIGFITYNLSNAKDS